MMIQHSKAVMSAVMSVTLFAFAAPGVLTPEQRAEHKAAVVARVGGLLPRPGTPSGRIAIINAQRVVPVDEFKATYAKNTGRFKGVDHWAETEDAGIGTAAAEKKRLNAQFAIFIVNSKTLPMSLIAPEECWAIMNVRPLAEGNADKGPTAHRARNEFARVLGILLGGVSSQFPSAIMNSVSRPSDLNGCTDELPVDVTAKIPLYLEKRGVKGVRLTSYQRACQEGWAPPPTNDVQKAIWEKIKAEKERGPTNPITIQPPNAKK